MGKCPAFVTINGVTHELWATVIDTNSGGLFSNLGCPRLNYRVRKRKGGISMGPPSISRTCVCESPGHVNSSFETACNLDLELD
ncbi:hypothetical protein GJ496_008324 [Pomphorhynchus laevis]|nr:hypothetical protein GJ496_008324 [Pomphorhynchus laevis]